MVYSVSQNKAIINGQNGIYDKKVTDPDVKYGRNAENNYESYTKELGAKVYSEGLPHPPLEFETKYQGSTLPSQNQLYVRIEL